MSARRDQIIGRPNSDQDYGGGDISVIQIGIDFGGTKIEAAALDADGRFLARVRTPNPGDYDQSIRDVGDLIARAEAEAGGAGTVGIGTPGSINPRDGLMRNANATFLNGRAFREDLEAALGREVRMEPKDWEDGFVKDVAAGGALAVPGVGHYTATLTVAVAVRQ